MEKGGKGCRSTNGQADQIEAENDKLVKSTVSKNLVFSSKTWFYHADLQFCMLVFLDVPETFAQFEDLSL